MKNSVQVQIMSILKHKRFPVLAVQLVGTVILSLSAYLTFGLSNLQQLGVFLVVWLASSYFGCRIIGKNIPDDDKGLDGKQGDQLLLFIILFISGTVIADSSNIIRFVVALVFVPVLWIILWWAENKRRGI